MDPSEFEGTVERKGDVLSAGTLEVLLTDAPQFVKLDLSKESDEIYMTIFNVKESLKKWEECSLSGIQVAWDEQAIKIAELKEEVSVRKKALASKIRSFVASHLSGTAEGEPPQDIKADSKELIDAFKAEFDHLMNSARYSETAFLATYKHLRGVTDPSLQLEECLRVCIRAQETLKNAQEQLNIAATRLAEAEHEAANEGGSGYANAKTEEMRQKEFEGKLLEQEERFKAEMADMRAKFDTELRNREHDLRSTFERQQMEHQEQYDKAMARKESEVTSLLASLNEFNQRNMEGEERQKMLDSEVAKRRELEEKLRTALTDLAKAQTALQELQVKYDASCARIQAAEAQVEATTNSLKQTIESAEAKASTALQKLAAAETELQARPPIDLSYIADSLGMAGEHITEMLTSKSDSNSSNSPSSSSSSSSLSWQQVEQFVVDSVRRTNHEATESRVKEQEASRKLRLVEEECSLLRGKLKERDETVAALEKDLVAAHQLVESNKALLKCYNNSASQRGLYSEDSFSLASASVDAVGVGSHNQMSMSSPAGKKPVGSKSHYSSGAIKQGAGKGGGANAGTEDDSWGDIIGDDTEDLEKGSGGRGTAAAVLSGADSSSSADRMMQAVQAQRDRFMKIARDKETEVSTLRTQLDRAQSEQVQLRNDNLELYRRLRLLRAQTRGEVGEDGYSAHAGSGAKSRLRKDAKGAVVGSSSAAGLSGTMEDEEGDAVDRKYMRMYEDKIDPFKLEELDRQNVLSRMNAFERALAYVTRFFLQDSWARHALLVYLLLVHCFALGYVIQVLNPQLIEEVDSHMKAKWAQQTMDMDMNREHPDI